MSFLGSLNDDAHTILSDFVSSLDNLPSEVAHILHEIATKEDKLQEVRSKLISRDASIQKHHKASGLLAENPKEVSQVAKNRADYSRVTALAEEKVLLAERGVRLLAKHLNRLNVEMARLQGAPLGATSSYGSSFYDGALNQNFPSPSASPAYGNAVALQDTSGANRKRKQLAIDTVAAGPRAHSPSPIPPGLNTSLQIGSLSASSTATTNRAPRSTRLPSYLSTPVAHVSRGSSPGNSSAVTTLQGQPPKRPKLAMPSSNRVSRANMSMEDGADEDGEGEEEDADGEDISEVGDMLGDDTLYCLCQNPSYGAMVGCDNAACRYEWFHYDCVGLKSPPSGSWFCPECRQTEAGVNKDGMKQRRR